MSKFKFKCEDRLYSSWELYDTHTFELKDKPKYDIDPIRDKLLNQDILYYEEGQPIKILHSSNREMPIIPGVILLQKNKTFGKYKKKYYFKVIPDDKRLPIFLVPYAHKKIGFNKYLQNKYVIFKFKHWDKKHPYGELVHTIGDVNELDNFYEYQLYSKSLYSSIQKFTKKTMQVLRKKSELQLSEMIIKKYNLIDRRDTRIYTIDPKSSKDYDDAFGIQKKDDSSIISIYITNVSLWLDVMELWDSFSQRIATIYLPDRKRPMLPTILSDAICSLKEKETRFAFTIDIEVDKDGTILNTTYSNSIINVTKNYAYEDKELMNNVDYFDIFNVVTNMNNKYNYIDDIINSHDVITYLMILMNYLSAKELIKHKNGIFRSVVFNFTKTIPSTLPKDIKKTLKCWNSTGSCYSKYKDYTQHDALKLDAYIHITSPIRRLIDILNILQLQANIGLVDFNEQSKAFFDKWTNDEALEYINTSMRSIRRVQNDCALLTRCVLHPKMMDETYKGYVFDCIKRNDALYQYMVYLPELKLLNKYISRYKLENYSNQQYKLYLFNDEINMKRKIMLELVDEYDV